MPDYELLSRLITTVGLGYDIIGAVLVAIGVVYRYRGPFLNKVPNEWIDLAEFGLDDLIEKSKKEIREVESEIRDIASRQKSRKLKDYEKTINTFAVYGLAFLAYGFILQIIGTWIS